MFQEPLGSYEICSICGWEDDEVQQRWPSYRGGANSESLCEAQAAILRQIRPEVDVIRGTRRHRAWRPLRAEECVDSRGDPDREPYVYYWDRDPSA